MLLEEKSQNRAKSSPFQHVTTYLKSTLTNTLPQDPRNFTFSFSEMLSQLLSCQTSKMHPCYMGWWQHLVILWANERSRERTTSLSQHPIQPSPGILVQPRSLPPVQLQGMNCPRSYQRPLELYTRSPSSLKDVITMTLLYLLMKCSITLHCKDTLSQLLVFHLLAHSPLPFMVKFIKNVF